MQLNNNTQFKTRTLSSLYLKCGGILLLLSLSVLVIACGSNTSTADLGAPQPTVTISFNNNASPTPTLAPYWCGAWVTNSTPAIGTSTISVNAKFLQNNNGNPEGMANAAGVATVFWGDGKQSTQNARTTNDGLAIFTFAVPADPAIVNHNNLVGVTFTSADGQHTCTLNDKQLAYFMFIMASPTATPSPSPQPDNNNNNGDNNGNGNGRHNHGGNGNGNGGNGN